MFYFVYFTNDDNAALLHAQFINNNSMIPNLHEQQLKVANILVTKMIRQFKTHPTARLLCLLSIKSCDEGTLSNLIHSGHLEPILLPSSKIRNCVLALGDVSRCCLPVTTFSLLVLQDVVADLAVTSVLWREPANLDPGFIVASDLDVLRRIRLI